MIKITQIELRARRCTMMTREKMCNCDFISRRRRGRAPLLVLKVRRETGEKGEGEREGEQRERSGKIKTF